MLFSITLLGCASESSYEVSIGPSKSEKNPSETASDTSTPLPSEPEDPPQEEIEEENEQHDSGTPHELALPNFILNDVNPRSPTYTETLSPRDYLAQVSGWYFIQST